MIKLIEIKKTFGSQLAINIPYFEAMAGEIIGVIGNNGAGKTTLFRLMLDLIKADSGKIYSDGMNISESENWKKYTSAFLNETFLITYLTSLEYFNFIGVTHGLSKERVYTEIENYKSFFDEDKNKLIRTLSKGNQYKVGIIGALLIPPRVLFLDEPFANLDPSSQIKLITILKNIAKKFNTLIFLSSHDLNHISELCSRIIIMKNGSIQEDIINTKDYSEQIKRHFI
jgi:ABC-2 type transport system ATP-binding protein